MKALVVLSGGQDSTTCLYWARREYTDVAAVSFLYNQRHAIEIESARKIAALAGVQHEIVDLGPLFAGLSPLTNTSKQVQTYDSADVLPGGLEDTFVPGRNILFLAAAANRAYVLNCEHVIIGISQEDFGGYPDCREDFIRSMEQALTAGLDRQLKIITPLMNLNKKETVQLAQSLPGCMEALANSTTCYNGQVPPCGQCHSCLLRQRGFSEAGVKDPLLDRSTAGV